MSYTDVMHEALTIRNTASNVRPGTGEVMTYARFIELYPQFGPTPTVPTPLISQMLVEIYLELASKCLSTERWRSYWEVANGWFVAHFCTLYLMSYADPAGGAAVVVATAESKGIVSSESASDVSVSYDVSAVVSDLDGWATWKLTLFGQQLATIGKLVGLGGMMV